VTQQTIAGLEAIMCGIAGILGPKRQFESDALRSIALNMAGSLRHRGPDDEGVWVNAEAGVALGHTRLAIIDLSPAGAQPMISSCGRFVLTYNGEVYNAPELRAELMTAGRQFRGHSDTEVLVEGFAVWGLGQTVERLIGMFAFAVWDRAACKLTLVRDRLGIKPLYWGYVGGNLAFASELRALTTIPGWQNEIDRRALAAFLRFGYVPAPMSIYRGINKLAPGKLLECGEDGEVKETAYWSLSHVAERGQSSLLDVPDVETLEMFESLLADSVRRRMVADVPLGMFLSGGVDSSAVAALMQANSEQPVRTFTIGFREGAYDEAAHAREVAAHLGTKHTELYVTPAEAQAVIPKLPSIYNEPFADASQVPTYLVSEMTRRHVTVALSGDGGDEVFAGYNRYGQGLALAKAARLLPRFLRAVLGGAITSVSPSAWDRLFLAVPRRVRPRLAGEKMHKLAQVLPKDALGFYWSLVSQGGAVEALVVENGGNNPSRIVAPREQFANEVAWMQFLDTLTYLPDDILTKVDRASMAVALEVRVPLLDHRVVELSWRLPQRLKLRRGEGKWLLRQIAYKYVPRRLLERPKMGFGVPIDQWLRGPLKGWAEDLLNSSSLREGGLLKPETITEKWTEHQTGSRNWQHFLWNVLMFEAWRLSDRSLAATTQSQAIA
jgi:asparagine synthase (glutamine-hydrolysing)